MESTKYFAKKSGEKSRQINPDDDKTKVLRNYDCYGNNNKRTYTTNIGAQLQS